jgi:hypothetical protein
MTPCSRRALLATHPSKRAARTDTLVRLLHDPWDPRLCFVLRVAAALRDKPKPPKPGCALRAPAGARAGSSRARQRCMGGDSCSDRAPASLLPIL